LFGLGNNILLTRDPLVVLNPALTTIAIAGPSSPRLTLTIFVPENKKCFANSGEIVVVKLKICNTSFLVHGNFETGTDSPVNILSFTIASPVRRSASQGKMDKWGSETS